jgi:hypothetical protein
MGLNTAQPDSEELKMQMHDYKHLEPRRKLIFIKQARRAAIWDSIGIAVVGVLVYVLLVMVMA